MLYNPHKGTPLVGTHVEDTEMKILAEEEKVKDEVGNLSACPPYCWLAGNEGIGEHIIP